MANKSKTSVLFVCMGNICRSPTAEGVFASIVERQSLEHLIAYDSAGTHAYHIGNPPDTRAQATAKQHNVDLSQLVARKIKPDDFFAFDYIIAMDKDNLVNLRDIQRNLGADSKAKLHLFMEFTKHWKNDEVPDPYYGGDKGFEDVFKMITDASLGLIKTITDSSK